MYCMCMLFFFFKQKTAYEMRISDWSSDVCSSDLQIRIGVRQIDDQADHDLVVFQVIQERAAGAVSAGDRQRPARAMHDEAEFVPGRIDLPEFLETDRVVLRVRAVGPLVALDQALAEVTAATFGKPLVLGPKFHARRVPGLRLAPMAR